MSSVVVTVFNTTELLERNIRYLDDIFELFATQRVCRKFKGTIEGSTVLKRKMVQAPHTG